MKTRSLFLAWVLAFSFAAGLSAGQYQRTYDGHSYVWNNYPRSGDAAHWSGEADSQGYATGSGTLTWYKNSTWVSRYTGMMVSGRLSGFVTNEDADGKRFQGTYVNGKQSSDWAQVSDITEAQSAAGPSKPEAAELLAAGSAGYINYSWAGVGDSTTMALRITNKTEREWEIEIEIGTKVDPSDGNAQSMVVTKEIEVHLHPHDSQRVEVQVACLDISKPPPGPNDTDWRTQASSGLADFIACVRRVLSRELPNVRTDGILQIALWKARGATRDQWIDFFVHYQNMGADKAAKMADGAEEISNALLQECPSR
jgi:hypothetical protein